MGQQLPSGFRLNVLRIKSQRETGDSIIESRHLIVWDRRNGIMKSRRGISWDGYKLQNENCICAFCSKKKKKRLCMPFVVLFYHFYLAAAPGPYWNHWSQLKPFLHPCTSAPWVGANQHLGEKKKSLGKHCMSPFFNKLRDPLKGQRQLG